MARGDYSYTIKNARHNLAINHNKLVDLELLRNHGTQRLGKEKKISNCNSMCISNSTSFSRMLN